MCIFGYELEGGLTPIEGAEVYAENFVPGTIDQMLSIVKANEDKF